MTDDAALLALKADTDFVYDRRGRMMCANDPTAAAAPLLWIGGCGDGNVFRLHEWVNDAVAARVARLVAGEPPLSQIDASLQHAVRYAELLGANRVEQGLFYPLPHMLPLAAEVRIVQSGSAAGERLITEAAASGLSQGMVDIGFERDASDFWPPWCAVLADDEVAAIAFASRLGPRAAELGVATAKAHRGHGFAAAATAAWATHPVLANRTLIYSTTRENISSQRVTERLGLRLAGVTFSLR